MYDSDNFENTDKKRNESSFQTKKENFLTRKKKHVQTMKEFVMQGTKKRILYS